MTISTFVNTHNAVVATAGTVAALLAQNLTKGSSGWVQGLSMFGALLIAVPLANHYAPGPKKAA